VEVEDLGGPVGVHVEDLVELAGLEEEEGVGVALLDVPPLLLGGGEAGLAEDLEHLGFVDPEGAGIVVRVGRRPAPAISAVRRVEELVVIVPVRPGGIDLLVDGERRTDEFVAGIIGPPLGTVADGSAGRRHRGLGLGLLTDALGRQGRRGPLGDGVVLLSRQEGGKVGKLVRGRGGGSSRGRPPGIGRGDVRRAAAIGRGQSRSPPPVAVAVAGGSTTAAAPIDGDLDRLLLLSAAITGSLALLLPACCRISPVLLVLVCVEYALALER